VLRWPRLKRGVLIGGLLAAMICAAIVAPAAFAKPGDLIVTSYDPGDVLRINPSTGHVSTISADPQFRYPQGLTFGSRGQIFVADYGVNEIFRIDPATGQISVRSADPAFQDAQYVDMGPDGRLYVPDDQVGSVFRLAPGSSHAVPFSSGGLTFPYGVEVDHDASILVGDDSVAKLVRVNRVTGAQHLVANASSKFSGFAGFTEAPNRTIYAATYDKAVARINPRTGRASTVSSGGLLNRPYDVALAPNGKLYVSNYDGTPGAPEVLKINPRTGGQSVVASDGGDLHAAAGIEIQPPKCAGRVANIVGSNKADHLKGSKLPDVIAGLGGRDVIKGLKGNDRLCGGKGKDRLIGGPGKDKLRGGPGKDVTHQ
jgi:streptogramin lyase